VSDRTLLGFRGGDRERGGQEAAHGRGVGLVVGAGVLRHGPAGGRRAAAEGAAGPAGRRGVHAVGWGFVPALELDAAQDAAARAAAALLREDGLLRAEPVSAVRVECERVRERERGVRVQVWGGLGYGKRGRSSR